MLSSAFILLFPFVWFLPVRRGDVLAAWSGIRPLVIDPKSADTQSISRNHVVDVSESGLITIAGMGGGADFLLFHSDEQIFCFYDSW